jgi:CRP-like cAMP-binding protein
MNKQIIKRITFFKNKPPYFIAFIGPLLKPLRIEAGNYVYREGDPIEEIYFLTRGKVAFVIHELGDLKYMTVEAGFYFGELDFLY